MTQRLLTLGAIPAISADTPHYPEETHSRGGGLSGGAAEHSVVNTDTRSAPAPKHKRRLRWGRGHISPTQTFYFRRDDVSDKKADGSPTLSFSLHPSTSSPLPDPSSAHMATRAGFGTAGALARIGGATRTCKQRRVAQRHHSRSEWGKQARLNKFASPGA